MFKELGAMMGLMRNLPRIKEEMEGLRQRLGSLVCEGEAGAGMITVRVNGHLEVLAVKLSDEATHLNDREMLEDLLRGAMNQALTKARQMVAEETSKMASGLGLPPGMALPGLS
jgi:DNA-binding YbaB/EbfC family protein